jgi:hypothetical protein
VARGRRFLFAEQEIQVSWPMGASLPEERRRASVPTMR